MDTSSGINPYILKNTPGAETFTRNCSSEGSGTGLFAVGMAGPQGRKDK